VNDETRKVIVGLYIISTVFQWRCVDSWSEKKHNRQKGNCEAAGAGAV